MKKLLFCLLVFYFIFIKSLFAQNRVVGYYADWMKDVLPAENIQFENLTHINHSFAWPDDNGNLMNTGLVYNDLNNLAHQNGVKVLIALGGWGNSDGFAAVATDSSKRAFFIDNLLDFIYTNNYDGVDFDWEHPSNSSQRTGMSNLVRDVRGKFDTINEDWLITMAVTTSNWSGQWLDYNFLIPYVNWFNAMCYDIHGGWTSHSGHNAPLFQPPNDFDGAIDKGMQYLHNTRKIPKEKLTVGIPFYGKEFNSSALYASSTGTVTDYRFSEIVPKMNTWNYNWDDVSKVPYLTNSTNTKLITFDDTVSVRTKCQWIINQGYSGAMIWALGQDIIGNSQPLLETIGREFSGITNIIEKKNINSPDNFFMATNYPNPFNPLTYISFSMKYASSVKIHIVNVNGQFEEILYLGKKDAGEHIVLFDGSYYASGTYFYVIDGYAINNSKWQLTGKMTLLK